MNSEALDALLHQENMIPAIQWLGEQIPGGFFIYRADESQEILFANQAVLRIFGCKDMNEFIMLTGNTFRGMVHPDDFHLIQESIDNQIDSEEGDSFDHVEYRIIRKDGEVRWVDDYGHFGYSPEYGDLYYVFISDITKQKTEMVSNEKYDNLKVATENLLSALSGAALSDDAKGAMEELKKLM